MIRIIGFPRLHIALADLAGVTLRAYGGVGVAINGLATSIEAEPSSVFSISGHEHLDAPAQAELFRRVSRLLTDAPRSASIRICTVTPQHVGLGSKSVLLLSVLEAASHAAGMVLPRTALQMASGRGGASGIGIHTYFCGGVLADGGHPYHPGVSFRPSSAASAVTTPPPVVSRLEFPSAWRVHLLLPRNGLRRSGEAERAFFRLHTPVPNDEALRTIGLIYHGVLSAVATQDISLLAESLVALHRTGFKRRELESQTPDVRAALDVAQKRHGWASGMSSMGPSIYIIAEDCDRVAMDEVARIGVQHDCEYLGEFAGSNVGRTKEVESG